MGKMIDLTINEASLAKNIEKAKENNIILPTIAQMKNPDLIPDKIKENLKSVGLWDVNPLNLFRITWKNEGKESGGTFGKSNYIVMPPKFTGLKNNIILMVGKWFPTGCHKVGASFGCLAPRLITGQFDASYHKAVWPSTGNYCRGGAFNSKLLAVDSVAILPQDMSKERFDWLKQIAGEIIATPGCESNVKEIFDKTWELKKDPQYMIFNQFEEMGNYMWHYNVTGNAIEEAFNDFNKDGSKNLAGAIFTSGSAGTMASGDRLKKLHPNMKLGVGEALQCPTILDNGFGGHRIEGIGDKHIPWIHNVKNTDLVCAIDDEDSQRLLRLFNDPEGHKYLKSQGVDDETINNLQYFGISGIANLLCAIKLSKYYELTENDVVATVMTDSSVMYKSRIEELEKEHGAYNEVKAAVDYHEHLLGLRTDTMEEFTYATRKRVHNLKYYTWVEQQARDVEDLNALWYDQEGTWGEAASDADKVDELINEFNERTGLLKNL